MEVWPSPVYGTCLENRRTEMFREFESHRFRHIKTHYRCSKLFTMGCDHKERLMCFNMGRLAEWLRQRFAKPSSRNGCISSNLISSANALVDKLVKSSLSKGEVLSVRIWARVPNLCGCATERLGGGLQIRFMQVRFLSPTPSLLFLYNSYRKKSLTFSVVVIYSCLFFKNLSLILLRSSIG